MTHPARQDPPSSVWSRFPLDPRSAGDLRAGDNDRETAREVITDAYTQGQLTYEEYTQRLGDALQANHLGQLVPLLNDIQVQPMGADVPVRREGRPPAVQPTGTVAGFAMPPSGVTRTALVVLGVTNLVWLWTCISSGSLIYYWPMWPALGMAIMVLVTMLSRDPTRRRDRELRREEQRERGELE